MRILLLCSAFNGLSQRAWSRLRALGHDVALHTVTDPALIPAAAAEADPDLIICPFLRQRVPEVVWRKCRTIIIHPGPLGDRGPSSLDWAIMDAAVRWGVTAVQAAEEFDAGPIWGSRVFAMPGVAPRKSTLYNEHVADAAMSLIGEVVAKAQDPGFTPRPLDYRQPDVVGRWRGTVRQADRAFDWADDTERILRLVRAADGRPGVHTTLAGVAVAVFDARPGTAPPGDPGSVVARRHGAVLVRTGDGALWIGQARRLDLAGGPALKLPATQALGSAVAGIAEMREPSGAPEISYRRAGEVGVVAFDFYNGAMSTSQCERLAAAVRHAAGQDTKAVLLTGGEVFSNGIHLGVIEAAARPALEAWRNINAINDVCREIIDCTGQLVVSALGGGAGAGGVMLALGADAVIVRDGVVLNPHYRTMGLYGSEYWTYVLPRRVGEAEAALLTARCEPVSATEAAALGLVDEIVAGDRHEFDRAALDYTAELAAGPGARALLERKQVSRAVDEQRRPLGTYRIAELAEMSRDIFDDRHGFAGARRAFLGNRPRTPGPVRKAA